MQLTVDLTNAPRKMIHAELSMPASLGPMTLVYSEWIPGKHGTTGPIDNLAGIVITANGRQIPRPRRQYWAGSRSVCLR